MKAEHAADLPSVRPRSSDTTRAHAINWFVSVTSIVLCALVGIYLLARSLLDLSIPSDTVWLILLAPLSGAMMGALKLIQFTTQHRQWLYALEDTLNMDINADGEIGQPSPKEREPGYGSIIRGVDGAYHRINTELSPEEMMDLKKHLLSTGGLTVRTMNDALQDDSRASALRDELYALGVLTKPRPRTVSKLTDAGRKAVMRWA